MPGPIIEVLSDDLRKIRSDLHKIEVNLAAETHKVSNTLANLGTEFAVLKWLLGVMLATTLCDIVGSAYWASSLASRDIAMERRHDKFDGWLERIELYGFQAILSLALAESTFVYRNWQFDHTTTEAYFILCKTQGC